MEMQPQDEALRAYVEQQEQVFLRLQPASETEERLARQIALCHARLVQMQGRLRRVSGQFQRIYDDRELPPAR
jgi:hypothetical protein